MNRHGLGIVGLGLALTPHAKSLIDLKDRFHRIVGCSLDAKHRADFVARYPFEICDGLEAILSDPKIDTVLVLTPPNAHRDVVVQAAAAGKNVLLEKPLEITTERAIELVEACERAGVKLGINLQHRFRPAGMKLRQILAAGGLGRMVECSTTMRLWRPQTYYDEPGRGTKARDGGGVLFTQGIHTLDLMLSLAGPICDVTGFATTTSVHRMETEDLVCAAVRFANGALGTIEATTASYPGFPERIELVGEIGSAMIAGTEMKIHYHDGRVVEIAADATPGGTGADPMAYPHDYHRAIIADFLDAVELDRLPVVNGREGLKVHRLIDALLETAATGKIAKVKS